MLPVPAFGSKTRRWHSHRSACSAVAPGGRTPNRNRGRPCSWPSGRSPRPPPPQSALSVFAAATRPPTAASGSQSSDRSVENCSLPGYHQGASRWRYSTPANPIKSDRLLGLTSAHKLGSAECYCSRATLDDLLSDEVMAPVLRSAGYEPDEFREMMTEMAWNLVTP